MTFPFPFRPAYVDLVAPTTSYSNTGGQGNRTGIITVTTNITVIDGTINNLVDGGVTANSSDCVNLGAQAVPDGGYIQFDFGSKKYIDEITIGLNVQNSSGNFQVIGSDTDGSGGSVYGSFVWDDPDKVVTLTGVPPQGHRYWRLQENDTGQSFPSQWVKEVTFKIADGAT